MRRLLLFVALLLAFSTPLTFASQGVHVTTSTNNLTTSYLTSFPGLALTLTAGNARHLYVSNGATMPIALTFTSSNFKVAPSSSTTTNPLQIFIGASSSTVLHDVGTLKYIWLRADGGATIASGEIIIDTW